MFTSELYKLVVITFDVFWDGFLLENPVTFGWLINVFSIYCKPLWGKQVSVMLILQCTGLQYAAGHKCADSKSTWWCWWPHNLHWYARFPHSLALDIPYLNISSELCKEVQLLNPVHGAVQIQRGASCWNEWFRWQKLALRILCMHHLQTPKSSWMLRKFWDTYT